MKKDDFKTEAQIEAEKREATELIEKILTKTNTIPPKVMNGSYQMAVNYKEAALGARSAAMSKAPRLGKLRDAWQSISYFFA